MEEEFELIEGKLELKKNDGGHRHYIKVNGQDHDICCGSYMEIQLGKYEEDRKTGQERLVPGEWIKGRYEACLGQPVKAYFIAGYICPSGDQATITIPLGTRVRVKK